MQFRRHYEVLTESDPRRALERLKTERIQVLVSDQRMPQMSGAELLAQARERYPETLRILLTGYSDLDAAVDALNDGGIFRYLTKPWNPQEMAFTLRQAAEIASRQGLPAPPAATLAAPLSVLLLDDDPETLDCVGAFCHAGGHRLLRARNLAEALCVAEHRTGGGAGQRPEAGREHTAPLLEIPGPGPSAPAQPGGHAVPTPRPCSELINQAQIFRYLPKPIRRGLFEKGLKAAAGQALLWRGRSLPEVDRLAEVPRDEREKERVGSLLGMLGRLRERLTA